MVVGAFPVNMVVCNHRDHKTEARTIPSFTVRNDANNLPVIIFKEFPRMLEMYGRRKQSSGLSKKT
jgi:hypothetical protein